MPESVNKSGPMTTPGNLNTVTLSTLFPLMHNGWMSLVFTLSLKQIINSLVLLMLIAIPLFFLSEPDSVHHL